MMTLKDRLKKGDIVIGPWCVIPSPEVIDIISKSGMDFVIIDMEHGFHPDMVNMIRAAQCNGCAALVRASSESDILHAFDGGADGVLVPHIEDPISAVNAVKNVKYHPVGTRGFSPYTRAGGYSLYGVETHADVQNKKVLTGLIIEGKNGIHNLDKIIAAVKDDVDIIYIGAYDLSQSMGVPGQVDHPDVISAIETSIKKITDAGITPGAYVAKHTGDVVWMVKYGIRFITTLPDCTVLFHAFDTMYKEFRVAVKWIKK